MQVTDYFSKIWDSAKSFLFLETTLHTHILLGTILCVTVAPFINRTARRRRRGDQGEGLQYIQYCTKRMWCSYPPNRSVGLIIPRYLSAWKLAVQKQWQHFVTGLPGERGYCTKRITVQDCKVQQITCTTRIRKAFCSLGAIILLPTTTVGRGLCTESNFLFPARSAVLHTCSCIARTATSSLNQHRSVEKHEDNINFNIIP